MIKAQKSLVAEYVERWKRGESLAVLARESGLKRSKLRRELIKAVGGKDRYRELRKNGAGGSSTPPLPPRRTTEAPPIDDSGVPVIPHTRGWRSRIVYVNRYSTSVFIDPNGTEYVRARPNEKADLIVDLDQDSKIYKGLGKVRLRKLESSSLYRKMKKTEKERERGEAALERQREQRRQRRAARRKGGIS